jgi:hypothetical protein
LDSGEGHSVRNDHLRKHYVRYFIVITYLIVHARRILHPYVNKIALHKFANSIIDYLLSEVSRFKKPYGFFKVLESDDLAANLLHLDTSPIGYMLKIEGYLQ